MPPSKPAPRRTDRYLVAALHYAAFQNWCRQHDINPHSVKYVGQPHDLDGNHGHHVVLLRDYHRHPLFAEDGYASVRLLQDSYTTYYEWDVPVVENGRIVGWQ